MDDSERAEKLRRRRETLVAGGDHGEDVDRLDEEVAEAEGEALTGSGAPRTPLEGPQAARYVAALMRQGPHGVNASRLRADALSGTARALSRLRLACLRAPARFAAHARVSFPPRRPGRAARTRRGPARAAPALPRPAGAA